MKDTVSSDNESMPESDAISTVESATDFSIKPYKFIVSDLTDVRIGKDVLSDYYITNIGSSLNLFTIDEDLVLWGSGYNQFGQLGQGTTDSDFHTTPVKIADDVIHVDYSQRGYVIYLTKDGTLYGMGNNGTGALMQLYNFSSFSYLNGENYTVSTPRILMDEVTYARCGREDVVALKADASVWTWGLSWYNGAGGFFRPYAEKVLDDAQFVTGGFFNHAILKKDGTVWTWGYNSTGNCGIANEYYISAPQQIASDVKMVWTGQLNYNVAFHDLSQADELASDFLENTIIQKKDNSFWACGINIGNTSKIISPYYEMEEFETICTPDFYPCIITE